MSRRPRSVGLLLVLLAIVGLSVRAVTGQARFASRVDLVALNVSVLGPQHGHVGGLTESDFVVYEDGVPQQLTYFAAGPTPIDLAVVLDASSSMARRMPQVGAATAGLVRGLGGHDHAAVFAFSARVRELTDFADDPLAIDGAIRGTRAIGATALYDAISRGLQKLSGLAHPGEARRQALIVVTDGIDTSSRLSFEEVRRLALRSGVGIYAIELASTRRPSGRSAGLGNGDSIQALARDTGGQSFDCSRSRDVADMYRAIVDGLRLQYTLAFPSSNPRLDGRVRRLAVRVVTRPDAILQTRTGYIADAPAVGPGAFTPQ